MTEAAKNQIGIFTNIAILATIIGFVYLIQILQNTSAKYFLIAMLQIFLSGILFYGVGKPHKCLFFRLFPMLIGFYLYPFVGNAAPYYLAGLGIVLGIGFFSVGVINYLGIF